MQEEIECHAGQRHPQEPLATAFPDAGKKQHHDKYLDDIVNPIIVFHDDRPRAQGVAQQMVFVQLDALAENVLHQRRPSRSGDVGPSHEFSLHHGFSRMTVHDSLGLSGSPHAVALGKDALIALPDCCRVFQPGGVAECLYHVLPLSLKGILGHLLARHFLGPHEGVILPAGKSPHQGSRQDNRQQQVFRTEKLLSIHEEGIHENLQSVVQTHACRKDKEQHGLHDGQLPAFLNTFPRDIKRHDQQQHRYAEMIGNGKG